MLVDLVETCVDVLDLVDVLKGIKDETDVADISLTLSNNC
jgi:hypothetical protein